MDLNDLLGNAEQTIECPECRHHFSVKVTDLFKEGYTATCHGCGKDITFVQDSKTKQELKDTNKAIKDFEKALKRLGA